MAGAREDSPDEHFRIHAQVAWAGRHLVGCAWQAVRDHKVRW